MIIKACPYLTQKYIGGLIHKLKLIKRLTKLDKVDILTETL